MPGTHAGTTHKNFAHVVRPLLPIDFQRTGGQFLADIIIPALLHFNAGARGAVIVPAFAVNAVCRDDLQLSGINPGRCKVAHVAVFPVKKAAALAGKNQNGPPGVAVYLEFHIAVQVAAVFFVITDLHDTLPSCTAKPHIVFFGSAGIAANCFTSFVKELFI